MPIHDCHSHTARHLSVADANRVHIAAVRREFDGAHDKMDRVHAEAAALGGALLEATAAAAAAGAAVRELSQHAL